MKDWNSESFMMWLLDWRSLTYTAIFINTQYCERYDINTKILCQTCTQIWPTYLKKLEQSREIPVVDPNFRLKQYQTTTSVYSNIKFESYVGRKIKKEEIHN